WDHAHRFDLRRSPAYRLLVHAVPPAGSGSFRSTRLISPTIGPYATMAIRAIETTKINAPLNEPVRFTIYPMTMGVVIPARFPIRLKRPPLTPMSGFGEVSAITVHPSAPNPLPKKASDISAIMTH